MRYLNDKQHYVDLYDLLTIKECLRLENRFSKPSQSLQKIKASDKEKLRAEMLAHNLLLYYTKGDHYCNKETTIQKRMEADRLRDEKLENATPYHKSKDLLLFITQGVKSRDFGGSFGRVDTSNDSYQQGQKDNYYHKR